MRAVLVCTLNTDSREADAMRKLTFGMNLSLVETRTFPDGVVLTRYETRR